jgi:hypothetical protein
MLSDLRFTDSDYPFDIFNLFWNIVDRSRFVDILFSLDPLVLLFQKL